MEKRIEKDESLGFPVMIVNPTYTEFEGDKVLDVNPKSFMQAVFNAIPEKKGRLSGAEVRFLRSYMHLTQKAFGLLIGVDHSSVAKWESKKQEASGMDIQVEAILRARCRLHNNRRAHIGESFLDNVLSDYSEKGIGEPLQVCV